MKKTLIAATLLAGMMYLPCVAQELSLGGGLVYGSNINYPGINLRGDVRFQELWSVSPNFNLFFNKRIGAITREWKDLNIDVHLYFKTGRRWKLYPLFGLNFATVSEKEGSLTYTNSDVGINLGLGPEFRIDRRLSGFGEIKYVVSEADQVVLAIGLIYRVTE